MKKTFALFMGLFVSTISFAQSNTTELQEINQKLSVLKYHQTDFGRYKLYPTENLHIFLKLDTGTGIIKLLQWSLKDSNEFETYLNSEDLSNNRLREAGRFELYPTTNMYQFILIDTLFGTTWHVQWGFEKKEMWIRRISY